MLQGNRKELGNRKKLKKKLQAIYPLNVINLNSTLNLSTLSWTSAAANDHAQVTYTHTHTLQSHMQTLYLSLMLVAVKRGEKVNRIRLQGKGTMLPLTFSQVLSCIQYNTSMILSLSGTEQNISLYHYWLVFVSIYLKNMAINVLAVINNFSMNSY